MAKSVVALLICLAAFSGLAKAMWNCNTGIPTEPANIDVEHNSAFASNVKIVPVKKADGSWDITCKLRNRKKRFQKFLIQVVDEDGNSIGDFKDSDGCGCQNKGNGNKAAATCNWSSETIPTLVNIRCTLVSKKNNRLTAFQGVKRSNTGSL